MEILDGFYRKIDQLADSFKCDSIFSRQNLSIVGPNTLQMDPLEFPSLLLDFESIPTIEMHLHYDLGLTIIKDSTI